MTSRATSITKLLSGPISNVQDADAVLELAFLMSAVDGVLADEELVAFRALVSTLRGSEATKKDVDDLIERFVVASHTNGVEQRTRQVAPLIPKELRETAFKVVVALAHVDHDESEWEDEMIGILGALLELADRAITLAREARKEIGAD
jgi:uncharacterized tellurite resistance protein B-like protein